MGEGAYNREPTCLIKSGGREPGGVEKRAEKGRRRRGRDGEKKAQTAESPLLLTGAKSTFIGCLDLAICSDTGSGTHSSSETAFKKPCCDPFRVVSPNPRALNIPEGTSGKKR